MILHISDSKPNNKYHFASIQYLYPLPEQARRGRSFAAKGIYAKLQGNMEFINCIQDQYMNPDQLPKPGQWPTSSSSSTLSTASIWI